MAQPVALLAVDSAGLAAGNFADVMACYGETVLLREVPGVPVLVHRLLVGVGDHCNPQHCFLYALLEHSGTVRVREGWKGGLWAGSGPRCGARWRAGETLHSLRATGCRLSRW